ncbi:MAG TPA: hypothetical protein VEC93_21975 [Anaerolineae bacterium]|nr:hypothetical protein [Anaerolineae bacterium]
MKIVIGLFEDKQDLACAVKKLYNHGLSRNEIKVINPSFAPETTLAARQSQGGAASINFGFVDGSATILTSSMSRFSPGQTVATTDPAHILADLGIPEPEASFYAVNVKRGKRLVIIQTGHHERALEAQRIIRQANARTSSGYE